MDFCRYVGFLIWVGHGYWCLIFIGYGLFESFESAEYAKSESEKKNPVLHHATTATRCSTAIQQPTVQVSAVYYYVSVLN
jgi:hypothetical protein